MSSTVRPSDESPLSRLPEVVVPAALLARVEGAGARILRPPPRPKATVRKLVLDVGMTCFCVGQLIWIARIVHLLP